MRTFLSVFALLIFAFALLFMLTALADLGRTAGADDVLHLLTSAGVAVIAAILWMLTKISAQLAQLIKSETSSDATATASVVESPGN